MGTDAEQSRHELISDTNIVYIILFVFTVEQLQTK